MTNEELHNKLITLAKQERELLNEILKYLQIVYDRRLYAKMGYSSLFEYCVKELKMSEGSAGRKISAMRLVKDLPEVQEKIAEGKHNLTNLSMAASFFKKEKSSPIQKREILQKLEGKSKRQVEKELIKISPESAPGLRSMVKPVTEEHTRLSLVLNKKQLEKLKRLKEIKNLPETDLLEWLMDRALKEVDPVQRNTRKTKTSNTRHIPAHIKKQIHIRDGGRCQYRDPKTGRQCSCRVGLQIDHLRPYALGGGNDIKNLRLLCPEHNKLKAIEHFGVKKMTKYLKTTPAEEGQV